MVVLFINLLVLLLVFGLIWWVLTLLPLPAPFPLIVRVAMTVLFIIVLLEWFILPLTYGHPYGYHQIY